MDSTDEPVDVSVLEALIEVRRQQALVDQFCSRAEEMKGAVAAAVYERVLGDYATRRAALDAEAAPLVTRALAEYRTLRGLHDGVQRTHDAAQLDKDEIVFRHSIGEIDEASRDERLEAPERTLAESAERLASLEALDARFREALPDVDLSVATAAPPEPEAAAVFEPGAFDADPVVEEIDAAPETSGEKTVWLADLRGADSLSSARRFRPSRCRARRSHQRIRRGRRPRQNTSCRRRRPLVRRCSASRTPAAR